MSFRVFSEDEVSSVPGHPVLEVGVNPAIDEKLSMLAITVRLRLIEDISLARNTNISTRAPIWAKSTTGLINFEEFEGIDEVVDKYASSFCDLYDKANPRPATGAKDQVKDSKEDAKNNSKE